MIETTTDKHGVKWLQLPNGQRAFAADWKSAVLVASHRIVEGCYLHNSKTEIIYGAGGRLEGTEQLLIHAIELFCEPLLPPLVLAHLAVELWASKVVLAQVAASRCLSSAAPGGYDIQPHPCYIGSQEEWRPQLNFCVGLGEKSGLLFAPNHDTNIRLVMHALHKKPAL